MLLGGAIGVLLSYGIAAAVGTLPLMGPLFEDDSGKADIHLANLADDRDPFDHCAADRGRNQRPGSRPARLEARSRRGLTLRVERAATNTEQISLDGFRLRTVPCCNLHPRGAVCRFPPSTRSAPPSGTPHSSSPNHFASASGGRLALVGMLAGELSSGGAATLHLPSSLAKPVVPTIFWKQAFFLRRSHDVRRLIGIVVVVGLLWMFLIYVNSVMRFILFDSVVAKRCEIQLYWARRHGAGFRYFVWQLLPSRRMVAGLTILLGIPAALAVAAGWLQEPRQHILPLVLGGMVLFF